MPKLGGKIVYYYSRLSIGDIGIKQFFITKGYEEFIS
jgi:hypothetical protein